MQITGQAACCADHDRVWITRIIDRADQFTLTDQWFVANVVDPLHFVIPFIMQGSGLGFVLTPNMIIAQCYKQFLQGCLGISYERYGLVFVSIEFSDIDIDESRTWILECGFAGGGEITVTCANANNEIG